MHSHTNYPYLEELSAAGSESLTLGPAGEGCVWGARQGEFRSLLGSDRWAWHAPAPFLHILELTLAAGTAQTFCRAHGSAGVALDYLAVASRTADSTAVPG